MKRIYSAANLMEAHLVSHLLDEAGITHHIFNENLQGGIGEIPFTHTYPEIWIVDEADEARARAVIAGFEQPAAGTTLTCRACGEENPDTFEVCWHCGRPIRDS